MELNEALAKIGTLEAEKQALKDKIETEGFRAREAKRELQAQLDAANTKVTDLETKVPSEGAVVLSKADSDRYMAYQALGKPDEVKAALEAGTTAQNEAKTLKRSQAVADAAGKDYNAKALGAHLPATASLESKKATVNGKETTVYEVVDGDTRTGLEDYVKTLEGQHDYVQFRAAPLGVQVLGQVTGDKAGPKTTEERKQELRAKVSI